ncbi:MAG: hypothetical protein ABI718_09670 [Acidobacteriota bacterium]
MKVHIRRQGIVIRTVEIKGEKATVGSGADCDIRVDDPYLAGHVADLVSRGGQWRIVDTATSIEGVSRGGVRIEDEALVSGEPYSVGAFEIVAEGTGVTSTQATAPTAAVDAPAFGRGAVPETMMQSYDTGGRPVPKTLFEAEVPRGTSGSSRPAPQQFQPQAAPSGFQPVSIPAPRANTPVPQQAPPPKSGSKMKLILIVLIVLVVVVGLVAVMMGRKNEPVATATVAATPVPPPTPTPIPAGDLATLAASNLEIDKALEGWETELQKAPTDDLRQKYTTVAYDAAMVYAAGNDSARSRKYLEGVVKFGVPTSDEVQRAKAKLGS